MVFQSTQMTSIAVKIFMGRIGSWGNVFLKSPLGEFDDAVVHSHPFPRDGWRLVLVHLTLFLMWDETPRTREHQHLLVQKLKTEFIDPICLAIWLWGSLPIFDRSSSVKAYGIPVTPCELANSPQEASAAAEKMGASVRRSDLSRVIPWSFNS